MRHITSVQQSGFWVKSREKSKRFSQRNQQGSIISLFGALYVIMKTAFTGQGAGMPRQSEQTSGKIRMQPDPTAVRSVVRSVHLRSLFEEHNRALVSYLALKLNSESEAKDVAQEAYVRLLQLDHPETISFMRAYLFRTATNIAMDHLRQRSVRERSVPDAGILFEQLLTRPGPERVVISGQQLNVVKVALKKLPEKCRRAFLLHIFAERSVPEIASELNLTERMVRYHIARGLASCKVALDAAD